MGTPREPICARVFVSATNMLKAIDKAKQPSLWRFLNALGIPNVGAQTARDLAEHFGTLERIESADEAALTAVSGIGPTVARDVAEFFGRAVNRRVIELCRRRGVQVIGSTVMRRGPLAGKTVVFTGGLEMARQAGVKLVINTDAHRIQELDCMRYGVDQARRGWCEAKDVANTCRATAFRKLIEK